MKKFKPGQLNIVVNPEGFNNDEEYRDYLVKGAFQNMLKVMDEETTAGSRFITDKKGDELKLIKRLFEVGFLYGVDMKMQTDKATEKHIDYVAELYRDQAQRQKEFIKRLMGIMAMATNGSVMQLSGDSLVMLRNMLDDRVNKCQEIVENINEAIEKVK